jgi:hypothetical protein
MRIGISVVTHEGQNIWENGLGQNVIFLVKAFQSLPFVTSVVLIDVGDQGVLPPQVDMSSLRLRIMNTRAATEEVDVVFELGGVLDVRWLDLMRARGRKVVFYCCGQPFVGLAEAPVFGKPGHASRADRCDEVWLLPKDASLIPLMRTLHRCDVHVVPYIWGPQFIERRAREVEEHGVRFGYQARPRSADGARAGFRAAILEPNISIVKTSTISMLICDEAYRADPGSIQFMHALNTVHMKDHSTMLYLANSLDLVRGHKAVFHGRHDIAGFMAQYADAVVSHQWCNDQNYSYLDALHGDYPLIHNSPWLKDAGYYYPDFDVAQGAAQLRLAAATHEDGIDDYRARSRRMFDAVDPLSRHNLEAYAARLLHLCRDTAFAAEGGRR